MGNAAGVPGPYETSTQSRPPLARAQSAPARPAPPRGPQNGTPQKAGSTQKGAPQRSALPKTQSKELSEPSPKHANGSAPKLVRRRVMESSSETESETEEESEDDISEPELVGMKFGLGNRRLHDSLRVQGSPRMARLNSPQLRDSPTLARLRNSPDIRSNSPRLELRGPLKTEYRGSPKLEHRNSPSLELRNSPRLEVRGSPRLSRGNSPQLGVRNSPRLRLEQLRNSPSLELNGSPRLELKSALKPEYRSSPNLEVRSYSLDSPRTQLRNRAMRISSESESDSEIEEQSGYRNHVVLTRGTNGHANRPRQRNYDSDSSEELAKRNSLINRETLLPFSPPTPPERSPTIVRFKFPEVESKTMSSSDSEGFCKAEYVGTETKRSPKKKKTVKKVVKKSPLTSPSRSPKPGGRPLPRPPLVKANTMPDIPRLRRLADSGSDSDY